MTSKAVFLDKDGTLIDDVPYNIDPDRIRLSSGALEALCLLQEHGYQLILVSNQSGVARGYFTESELAQVETKLRELLSWAGLELAGFYYCPHHPRGAVRRYAVECACRKPRAGMLYRAALEHHLDLSASWLVGDILDDVGAGNRAGCRTVLLDIGHETKWKLSGLRQPDFIAKSLLEAAQIIAREPLYERDLGYGHYVQRSDTCD